MVAFRDHLEERLPEWDDRDGYWPLQELNEQRVRYYVFPAARLERVDVEEASDSGLEPESKDEREAELEDGEGSEDDETESDPEPAPEPEPAIDMDGLAQRLEDAGCAVARRDRGLRVSKLGETYRIEPAGEIEGDGALRERLAEIVEQFEEADDE